MMPVNEKGGPARTVLVAERQVLLPATPIPSNKVQRLLQDSSRAPMSRQFPPQLPDIFKTNTVRANTPRTAAHTARSLL